jgi:hypothetical protein
MKTQFTNIDNKKRSILINDQQLTDKNNSMDKNDHISLNI